MCIVGHFLADKQLEVVDDFIVSTDLSKVLVWVAFSVYHVEVTYLSHL